MLAEVVVGLGGLLSVSLLLSLLVGILGREVASSLRLANAVLDRELVVGGVLEDVVGGWGW